MNCCQGVFRSCRFNEMRGPFSVKIGKNRANKGVHLVACPIVDRVHGSRRTLEATVLLGSHSRGFLLSSRGLFETKRGLPLFFLSTDL